MKPVLLCILDGVGIREERFGNAFKNANTPNFDFLWENYPHAVLNASEEYVGLPKGQMGNSEVGHTNIGAGRIVYQSLELINKGFKNHEIDNNEKLLEIISYVKKNNKKLHIMGLVSDGGIHAHIDHLNGIISIVQKHGLEDKIFIHAITDGRDTLYNSSYSYIEKLKSQNIASISGRYYAMDRDKRYERTNFYFDTITGNNITNMSIKDYINNSYANNETDEFIKPALFIKEGKIEKDDVIDYYCVASEAKYLSSFEGLIRYTGDLDSVKIDAKKCDLIKNIRDYRYEELRMANIIMKKVCSDINGTEIPSAVLSKLEIVAETVLQKSFSELLSSVIETKGSIREWGIDRKSNMTYFKFISVNEPPKIDYITLLSWKPETLQFEFVKKVLSKAILILMFVIFR